MIQSLNLLLSFLLFTIFLRCADAYFVHSSCGTDESTIIHDSMREAFDMASQALTALETTPRDANVNRLIRLLFAAPDQDPATFDVSKLKKTFRGVRSLGNRLDQYPFGNEKEVVIYCNLDRVVKNADDKYIDTDSGAEVAPHDNEKRTHLLDDCRLTDTILAFTWNTPTTWPRVDGKGHTNLNPHKNPSQVTICPWFMKWIKQKKYKTWKDLPLKGFLMITTRTIKDRIGGFTMIDGLNLFDLTMLHELTHTTVAGDLVDVETKQGGGRYGKGGEAYGWKAARYLVSNKQDYVDQTQEPQENSDSVAIFATAVRLLNLTPPKYVDDDGKLTTTRPTKRDAMLYADQATTPVLFEGFITMVKEKYAAESDDPIAYLQI